jgi:hypothetical protein
MIHFPSKVIKTIYLIMITALFFNNGLSQLAYVNALDPQERLLDTTVVSELQEPSQSEHAQLDKSDEQNDEKPQQEELSQQEVQIEVDADRSDEPSVAADSLDATDVDQAD